MRLGTSWLLFGLSLILVMAGCRLPTPEPPADARVRVLHGLPGAPPVDVLVDGERVLENLAYAEGSAYLAWAPGSVQLSLTLAGDAETVVLETELELEAGRDYTVIASSDIETGMPIPLIIEADPAIAGITAVNAFPLQLPVLPEEPPEEALLNVFLSPPGAPLAEPELESLAFGEVGVIAGSASGA